MAGENVSAINPCFGGGLYNNYANSVMLDDLCGFGTTPSMMSLNGSLFSGATTPFMPTFTGGGMNYEQYFDNMEKYQDFMYDSQIRQAERRREVNFRANVPDIKTDEELSILHEKIMRNEQEQIIPALQAVMDKYAQSYGRSENPQDLIAMVKYQYRQKYNTDLTEDIRKYGNGSITQGFLQAVSLGLADSRTAEENVSIIDNQPVARAEDTKKIIGNAAGGALIGSTSMLALSSLKCVKHIFKSKPLVAAIVGGVIGLLSGAGIGALHRRSSTRVQHPTPQTNV